MEVIIEPPTGGSEGGVPPLRGARTRGPGRLVGAGRQGSGPTRRRLEVRFLSPAPYQALLEPRRSITPPRRVPLPQVSLDSSLRVIRRVRSFDPEALDGSHRGGEFLCHQEAMILSPFHAFHRGGNGHVFTEHARCL